MPRLIAFEMVSLDGYFTDARNDMSFAYSIGPDAEFEAFTRQNAQGDARLVFGRKTYDLMASVWPTPAGKARMPEVAAKMNGATKIVFSRSMKTAGWARTQVLHGDPASEMAALKARSGPDLVILGSGEIVARLSAAGRIDEFHLVLVPRVLGSGRTLFEGLEKPLTLQLVSERAFKSGRLSLKYAPVR